MVGKLRFKYPSLPPTDAMHTTTLVGTGAHVLVVGQGRDSSTPGSRRLGCSRTRFTSRSSINANATHISCRKRLLNQRPRCLLCS